MAAMNLTGLLKAMPISDAVMNKIAETLSFERNRMLLSLAANYVKRFEEIDADLDLGACNRPYVLVTRKYPKWECRIHGDIMEIKTECCLELMQEGSLLMGYFREQLGEDITHIIKEMTVIPSLKDVTFRFELYPVTITAVYLNGLQDRAEKLENENKKLLGYTEKLEDENKKFLSEIIRLSAENAELREKLNQKPTGLMVTAKLDPNWMDIKEHFRNWTMALGFDAYNHKSLSKQVKKIVSNPKKRTTVILWKNGDKTITKAMKGEKFDAEKGIAMAFMKYAYGNNGAYMKEIRKAIAEDQKVIVEDQKAIVEDQKVIAEDQK